MSEIDEDMRRYARANIKFQAQIARLHAENERLTAALQEIIDTDLGWHGCTEIARRALEPKP